MALHHILICSQWDCQDTKSQQCSYLGYGTTVQHDKSCLLSFSTNRNVAAAADDTTYKENLQSFNIGACDPIHNVTGVNSYSETM